MIIKGCFCVFLRKSICCGYSLESPWLIRIGDSKHMLLYFLHKSICCGYSLESPRLIRIGDEYPQHMLLWRTNENYL